jgi:exodeoxyribonuclease VII small subunit
VTTQTYETATGRLEEIIKRLDSGEAGLRETLDLCREGRELVEWCAGELDAVGQGLEELKLDELVARLEAGASGPGGPDPVASPDVDAPSAS